MDDGALLVVAKDDRTLRIEVGYGWKGAPRRGLQALITRSSSRVPAGDFYGGITAGVDRILRVIDGEPVPKPEKVARGEPGSALLPVLMILALGWAGLHTVLGRFPAHSSPGPFPSSPGLLAAALIALVAG